MENHNFLYCTSITYPSSRANRIQTIAMAREFKRNLGDRFVLGGTRIDTNQIDESLSDSLSLGSSRSFVLAFKYILLIWRKNISHVYCREHRLLFFIMVYNKIFSRLPTKFFYEAHDIPSKDTFVFTWILKKVDGIVAITKHLSEDILRLANVKHVFYAPDGVDLESFGKKMDKESARRTLGIDPTIKIVLYTGHLYTWKGVYVLGEAAKLLSPEIRFVFVGGTDHDKTAFEKEFVDVPNIEMLGQKPHKDMPMYLQAADVLVLPNSGKETISKLYTSPLKMFEYMASGKPIVASDLPSIREVLGPHNSVLFTPDDPKSLASALERVFEDPQYSAKLAEQSLKDVRTYSWNERARQIQNFIETNAKR